MSPERLNELRRQRDAIQAHLNWLDAEIAREAAAAGESSTKATPATTVAQADSGVPMAPIEYEPDPVSAAADAKRGCLIWFVALFVLATAAAIALYFWKYSDHPLFFAPDDEAAHLSVSTRNA